jgi:hypothetical protein
LTSGGSLWSIDGIIEDHRGALQAHPGLVEAHPEESKLILDPWRLTLEELWLNEDNLRVTLGLWRLTQSIGGSP